MATPADPRTVWALASAHEERDAWRRLYDALFPPPAAKRITTCTVCGSMTSGTPCDHGSES